MHRGLKRSQGGLEFVLDLDEGSEQDLVLEIADGPLREGQIDPQVAWAETEDAWRRAVPELGPSIATRDSRHAYAVLRGMTSATGGMVAAATMSLPERATGGRDYDYGYCWIRDQCYAGLAVAADGPHPLLDDAVGFVSARLLEDGPRLKPAYTVRGETIPGEGSWTCPATRART